MNTDDNTTGFKTFEGYWAPYENLLHEFLKLITEDRRPWLRKRLANSLLFGSGASFFHYKRAPYRNEASLNEAIILRKAAQPFYEDDDERLAADAEGVCRYYEPKPPIAIDRKKDRKVPAAVAKRKDALAKRAKQKFDMRTRIAPDLRGFLDGAKYDTIDLMPSEMAGNRALINVSKAMAAMQGRVEQDILLCSEKWEEADNVGDVESRTHWESELFFAEEDERAVADFIKQNGFDATQ
jgi:hypothetical protein